MVKIRIRKNIIYLVGLLIYFKYFNNYHKPIPILPPALCKCSYESYTACHDKKSVPHILPGGDH